MSHRSIALGLAALLAGPAASAEDPTLRESKKETERRKKLKRRAPVYTNLDEPAGMLIPRPPADFVGPPWPLPRSSPSPSPSPTPGPAAAAAAAGGPAPAEPPHDEAYWRERMSLALQRIRDLESDLEWTRQRYFIVQNDLVVANDAKREFDRKLEHDRLLAERERLEKELERARAEPARLREEGRREGALPGWFR